MENESGVGPRQTSRGWTPDPDPTLLTMEQSRLLREEMYRAVGSLRELMEAKLAELSSSIDGFHARIPTLIYETNNTQSVLFEQKLTGLRGEFFQRFDGVKLQFIERDVRGDQANKTSEVAIAAAFLANEKKADATAQSNDKAIAKSELATKEKIDSLQALLTGSIDDIRGQIAGLTSRLDRGEGASKGVTDVAFERRGNTAMIVGIASLSATALTMIVGAVLFIASHVSTPAPAPVSYGAPTVVSPAVVPVQPK
jgi:hypothetical protein